MAFIKISNLHSTEEQLIGELNAQEMSKVKGGWGITIFNVRLPGSFLKAYSKRKMVA